MLLPSGLSTTNYSLRASAKGWGQGWTSVNPQCAAEHDLVVVMTRNNARIPMRTAVAELVDILIEEVERRGYLAINGWCWGYSCRNIAGSSSPSNHSWGLAFDLNAPRNPYTSSGEHDIPDYVFALFRAYGFGVGADYSGGKKDWMHFEFMGNPNDAAIMTALARRNFQNVPIPTGPSLPPTAPPYPGLLVQGSKGDAVRTLQTRLNAHRAFVGASLITVDGDFGPNTKKIVQWFQYNRGGLDVDGKVGPRTWSELWK